MKKKIFAILCAICLIVPCAFVFSGCRNPNQITISEIHTAFKNAELPTVDGNNVSNNYFNSYYSNITNQLLQWQRTFERNNIDTTDFMAMDYYRYYFKDIDLIADIYIFKFSNITNSLYTNTF